MGHTVPDWSNYDRHTSEVAQGIIAGILVNVQARNDSWVTLAAQVFGLPERDLREYIALRDDSVLLAIFIHVTRQSLHPDHSNRRVLQTLSKLDTRNTL